MQYVCMRVRVCVCMCVCACATHICRVLTSRYDYYGSLMLLLSHNIYMVYIFSHRVCHYGYRFQYYHSYVYLCVSVLVVGKNLYNICLVGGLEHFLCIYILGITPIDFIFFQRGWNHQPVYVYMCFFRTTSCDCNCDWLLFVGNSEKSSGRVAFCGQQPGPWGVRVASDGDVYSIQLVGPLWEVCLVGGHNFNFTRVYDTDNILSV